jgi:myosin-18
MNLLSLSLSQPEDKQKAVAGFVRLRGAMDALGITQMEQRAVWRVLAAIYHLGLAGACKGTTVPPPSPLPP